MMSKRIPFAGIYAIRHVASGLRYVGSTADVVARWQKHRNDLQHGKHHSPRLQYAWNKYGEDAFVFEMLQEIELVQPLAAMSKYEIDILKATLLECEQTWMDKYSDLYNVAPVAGSNLGIKRSEETRARQSASLKGKGVGRHPSEATRAQLSLSLMGNKSNTGRTLTPEHRANISAASKGRPGNRKGCKMPLEVVEKTRLRMMGNQYGKGKSPSAVTRAKLSEANRGRPMPESVKEVLRIANTGKKNSPETRAKISAKAKARPPYPRDANGRFLPKAVKDSE